MTTPETDSPIRLRRRPEYAAALSFTAILVWGLAIGATMLGIGDGEAVVGGSRRSTAPSAEQQALAQGALDDARQTSIEARSRLAIAEADYDSLVQRFAASMTTRRLDESPEPPAVDRRRQDLEERRAATIHRRALLLETMTTEHPEVLRVDDELGRLEQLLSELPKNNKSSTFSARAGADQPDADHPTDAAVAAARDRQLEARRRLQEADLAERSAFEQWMSVATRATETQPPPADADERERLAFWLITAVTALAMLIAASIAGFDPIRRRVFRSLAEVRNALPLPVIGCVGIDVAPRASNSFRLRLARAFGEVGVAMFALVALWAAAHDRSVVAKFSRDPLVGLRLAAEHVVGAAGKLRGSVH